MESISASMVSFVRPRETWGREKRRSELGRGVERENSTLRLSLSSLDSLEQAKKTLFAPLKKKMASDDERRVQMQLQQELQVAYMQEFYSVRLRASEKEGGRRRREEGGEEVDDRPVHCHARKRTADRPCLCFFPLFFSLFSPFLWIEKHPSSIHRRGRERKRKGKGKENGKTVDC